MGRSLLPRGTNSVSKNRTEGVQSDRTAATSGSASRTLMPTAMYPARSQAPWISRYSMQLWASIATREPLLTAPPNAFASLPTRNEKSAWVRRRPSCIIASLRGERRAFRSMMSARTIPQLIQDRQLRRLCRQERRVYELADIGAGRQLLRFANHVVGFLKLFWIEIAKSVAVSCFIEHVLKLHL